MLFVNKMNEWMSRAHAMLSLSSTRNVVIVWEHCIYNSPFMPTKVSFFAHESSQILYKAKYREPTKRILTLARPPGASEAR